MRKESRKLQVSSIPLKEGERKGKEEKRRKEGRQGRK